MTRNMEASPKGERVSEGRTLEEQFLSFDQIKDLQQSTKTQSHKLSGRVSLSLTPAPEAPHSPKIKIPIVMRTLNRRTALLFIFVALLAVALHAASLLYYQYSSLAAVRSEHEAKMLGLELSIGDLRSGLASASLKLELLDSRSRSNSWRNSLSTSEMNITGNYSNVHSARLPALWPRHLVRQRLGARKPLLGARALCRTRLLSRISWAHVAICCRALLPRRPPAIDCCSLQVRRRPQRCHTPQSDCVSQAHQRDNQSRPRAHRSHGSTSSQMVRTRRSAQKLHFYINGVQIHTVVFRYEYTRMISWLVWLLITSRFCLLNTILEFGLVHN